MDMEYRSELKRSKSDSRDAAMSEIGWADGQCSSASIIQKYLTSECNDRSVSIRYSRQLIFNVKQQLEWKAFIKLWQKSCHFCLIFISMNVRSIIRCAVILVLKSQFHFYPGDCVLFEEF